MLEGYNMKRPNILFIMSDDHAAHAISAYKSRINKTPNIDRIANEGMIFDNCFCTNSICAPSRATIISGTHTHINGVTKLNIPFDGRQPTFPKILSEGGYATAMIGKWHLGHGGNSDPTGFDYWNVLPGQGEYFDPVMIEMGEKKKLSGYVTDIITDLSINWLENRDKTKPFMLMCHNKAPHRPWIPDKVHEDMYENEDIPEPETFNDNYENRSSAAKEAWMRVDKNLNFYDVKQQEPTGLSDTQLKSWKYQRYIKDYLKCIASIDDNVGRILDYLEDNNLYEDTIVVYTSDQGFFLGDHGWFDKRLMYEESLRMPFVMRYPRMIKPGSRSDEIVLNLDFAQTFIDFAQLDADPVMQGRSFKKIAAGENVDDWRKSMYYRYYDFPSMHNVYPHYGIRTKNYKLICYYPAGESSEEGMKPLRDIEWELFDLEKDPQEMHSVYFDEHYKDVVDKLKKELAAIKYEAKDFD